MSQEQNKFADLIKSQGAAFRTFRKNQEAMVSDVAKRVDKLEAKGEFAVTDLAGYSQMFDACADLVESSPHPRLAAAALLNAAISINLCTSGADGRYAGREREGHPAAHTQRVRHTRGGRSKPVGR